MSTKNRRAGVQTRALGLLPMTTGSVPETWLLAAISMKEMRAVVANTPPIDA